MSNENEVETRLATALTNLVVDEYSLLEAVREPLPAAERAIATQLAWRLRTEYERAWDVDVEYNRAGLGTDPDARLPGGRPRSVDVSVHHRGGRGPEHNFLVVELKTFGVGDVQGELDRLEVVRHRYGYQHAVLLDLGMARTAAPSSAPDDALALDGAPTDPAPGDGRTDLDPDASSDDSAPAFDGDRAASDDSVHAPDGARPTSTPITLSPRWWWLPARPQDMRPVFEPDQIRRLAVDGLEARRRRYTWRRD